jgi:hypothetical protein
MATSDAKSLAITLPDVAETDTRKGFFARKLSRGTLGGKKQKDKDKGMLLKATQKAKVNPLSSLSFQETRPPIAWASHSSSTFICTYSTAVCSFLLSLPVVLHGTLHTAHCTHTLHTARTPTDPNHAGRAGQHRKGVQAQGHHHCLGLSLCPHRRHTRPVGGGAVAREESDFIFFPGIFFAHGGHSTAHQLHTLYVAYWQSIPHRAVVWLPYDSLRL